ncbi:hypothetical protein N7510_009394 [Penicillium lagena]|uniref:uncharacterized protein n=1 Tax=Penicillium lagena TaxID=94218 RepID=UPI0025421A02|nr:uncharacterized protein N7510_009394 [Penicillium lagena]KAJ5606613.1 hypothetical protein N7510_009394 [Penicillium lagena]
MASAIEIMELTLAPPGPHQPRILPAPQASLSHRPPSQSDFMNSPIIASRRGVGNPPRHLTALPCLNAA